MHLPDEFLSSGTATSLAGAALLAVGLAMRKVRSAFLEKVPVLRRRLATFPDMKGGQGMNWQSRFSKVGQEKMWRLAAVGSLIFSAQMVNFPIGGGTSGHLLGGVLAALILGPFEALLVMTVVLATQAFIFADGGLLALGANIFNMGIVGVIGGYSYFTFLIQDARNGGGNFLQSAFVAAWLSVIFAAIAASFEIAWSGIQALSTVLPAMMLTHIFIGLAEGMITVFVLVILKKKKFPLAILKEENAHVEE